MYRLVPNDIVYVICFVIFWSMYFVNVHDLMVKLHEKTYVNVP